jgi:hypothetical protein
MHTTFKFLSHFEKNQEARNADLGVAVVKDGNDIRDFLFYYGFELLCEISSIYCKGEAGKSEVTIFGKF